MRVTYNNSTKTYRCEDTQGNWYPQSTTMIGAIERAIITLIYWESIKNKHYDTRN